MITLLIIGSTVIGVALLGVVLVVLFLGFMVRLAEQGRHFAFNGRNITTTHCVLHASLM